MKYKGMSTQELLIFVFIIILYNMIGILSPYLWITICNIMMLWVLIDEVRK